MRRQLARCCRWFARHLIALANWLDPAVEPREAGRRLVADIQAMTDSLREFAEGIREAQAQRRHQ